MKMLLVANDTPTLKTLSGYGGTNPTPDFDRLAMCDTRLGQLVDADNMWRVWP